MATDRYLTAKQAAERLGVSLPTLYAYVSRGLIRSEATAEGKRQRRYSAEDIDRILSRKEAKRYPERVVESALHWGAPLLDSAITLISDGKFYYRGYDATRLALTETIESVASLIWTGSIEQARNIFDSSNLPSAKRYEAMLLDIEVDGATLSLLQSFQVFLPIAEADDPSAYDLRPTTIYQTGARIVRLMASVAAGEVPEDVLIGTMLARGWCPQIAEAPRLLNTALILCADHELNASSFTARVTASAGSTLYAVVSAGLATLQGAKHGGYIERVEALLNEVGTPEQARSILAARLRRGEPIPGFGHLLYPQGDPRARVLLEQLTQLLPDSPAVALSMSVIQHAESLLSEYPTIDFALAILARALKLPTGSALGLFALGRVVGWIGHAIEQYAEDRLIRPRARYIGDLPRA